MIAQIKPGVLTTFEALHETNPVLFDKLVTLIATRPEHGEIVLRFRDRKLYLSSVTNAPLKRGYLATRIMRPSSLSDKQTRPDGARFFFFGGKVGIRRGSTRRDGAQARTGAKPRLGLVVASRPR